MPSQCLYCQLAFICLIVYSPRFRSFFCLKRRLASPIWPGVSPLITSCSPRCLFDQQGRVYVEKVRYVEVVDSVNGARPNVTLNLKLVGEGWVVIRLLLVWTSTWAILRAKVHKLSITRLNIHATWVSELPNFDPLTFCHSGSECARDS